MQSYISDIIKIRGFLPLDEFITLALCHQSMGYYAKKSPIMQDFTTSPEISNAFGIVIASYIIDSLLKISNGVRKIHFVEFGGGTGKLAFDILNFVESLHGLGASNLSELISKITFNSIEFSEILIDMQKKSLNNIVMEKLFFPDIVSFKKNLNNYENDIFVFFSNEFFDALPIKQFVKQENNIYEIIVTEKSNNFTFEQVPINANNKKTIFNVAKNNQNTFFEIPFVESGILSEICEIMHGAKSIFLAIDYGFTQSPDTSTLQGIFEGKKTTNILENIGNTDITHLVDFNLMREFFAANKIEASISTQGEFLVENGILNLINPKNRDGIARLIDSEQMGEIFQVLIAKSF